ncbi:MAG: hypothetical protein J6W51_10775 [Fibrobacter sp.]|nr:hypothetical protein [Fibrobacter sp.]
MAKENFDKNKLQDDNSTLGRLTGNVSSAFPGLAVTSKDFKAEVYFLTKEDGFRDSPFLTFEQKVQFLIGTTGTSGKINFVDISDKIESIEGLEKLYPGTSSVIRVKLKTLATMSVGCSVELRFSGKKFATGIITEIIRNIDNPPPPPPPSDKPPIEIIPSEYKPTKDVNKFNDLCNKIQVTHPLVLFPLRLETSFCYKTFNGKRQKQLRVRIIPDEIMLDYKTNANLSQQEIDDGKFFWTQWFIASGCEKREKEAWDTLCSKYPLYKTAWICDSLRPIEYERICKDGDYFYRRPYVYRGDGDVSSCIEDVENKCKGIYDILEKINYDEDDIVAGYEEETAFERSIRTGLGKINSFIFDIDSELQSCQYIVDYLYDSVHDAFTYLHNHLQTLNSIYSKRPQMKEARSLELWDIDYSILTSLIEKNNHYMDNLESRRITLSDMVKKYLDEKKIEFPVFENIRDASKPIVPVCRALPQKFVLVAEIANKNKDIIYACSKETKASDIQMGFSLDTNKIAEGVGLDDNEELTLSPKMKWLTDYDTAEKLGMAITVNIDENVNEFRYLYVIGVQQDENPKNSSKSKTDASILRNLFYGHNFVNSNMRVLNAGVPTNVVDQEYVDEDDFLKDARYDIEVGGSYRRFSNNYASKEWNDKAINSIGKNISSFETKHASLLGDKIEFEKYFENIKVFLEFNPDKNYSIDEFYKKIHPTKDFYMDEYYKMEEYVLSLVSDDTEKESLKKDLKPLKEDFQKIRSYFFNESDYDARKLSYVLKGGACSDCFNNDFLKDWAHVVGNDSRQDYQAKVAFTALWDNLEERYSWGTNFSNPDRKTFLKDFFVNHVRARGNVAAFRIDNMPYGVLPTTDFIQMRKILKNAIGTLKKDVPENDVMYKNLLDLIKTLIKLANIWHKVRNENVKWSEVLTGDNIQKKYLEMAGQTPYSINFTERVLLDGVLNPSYLQANNSKDNNEYKDTETIFKFLNKDYFKSAPICDMYTKNSSSTFKDMVDTVKNALAGLGETNDKNAELFVTEFLDLLTHRIDAWFLGIIDYCFHYKLRYLDGGHVGAYGWVFNLKENSKITIRNNAAVKKEMGLDKIENLQLLRSSGTAHFITAPSIQHALTAAVLRSSYLQAKKNKGTNLQICVNLSSTRVRQALRLVEGVKSGMSLSIILGADFERYLHEAFDVYGLYMDDLIYSLRQLFPQITQIKAEDDRANDYIMQVVNGESLLNSFVEDWGWNGSVSKWLDEHYNEKLSWVNQLDGLTPSKRDCLFKIIEQLMDSYDALNDLLLSEGVHRLIMGDKSSYRAISKFLAEGEGNLPDMNILNIPSEHVVVTHKAGVLLPQTVECPDKVMCYAEPAMNAWIEEQFDSMENILIFIQRGEGETREIIPCSLKDLGVSGIEYLYLSAFDKTFHAYLEARFRTTPKFCTSENCYTESITIFDSALEVGYEYSGKQISLEDNKLRLEAIRGLVGRARAMNTADWSRSDCEDLADEDLIDVENLKHRLALSFANLEYLKNDIEGWLECTKGNKAIDDFLVAQAYTLLCNCFESGLINSLNKYDTSAFLENRTQTLEPLEYDRICNVQRELFHSVENALDSLKNRMEDAQNIVDSCKSVESYVSALQAITLKNFKVCYKFRTEPVKGKFQNSLDHSFDGDRNKQYTNLTVENFDQWQDEVSEVREGMKQMQQLCMTQLALDHEMNKVAILQTSIPDGQDASCVDYAYKKWLGVAVNYESELRDADSLVLYNCSAYKSESSGGLSGFVFDSWIEYIPYKKHDAGIAFHNDWPDNEAPQSILIAWHPELPILRNVGDGFWDMKTFVQVIRTTRFMMMNRALEPDYIYEDPELSKIFPLTPKINMNKSFESR